MGEAKRRRENNAQRLASAAGCIYCAGRERASTLDHMPPRAVFSAKQRPKGLEFPCCERCNAGTKTTDQVVALMSRISLDATSPEGIAEVRKYLNGVANNVPGLLEEMAGPPEWRRAATRRVPAGQHPLFCGGPLVSAHMERFSAKFGFAMHFELTGQPVGPGGGVAARWYSNADIYESKFPMEAWDVLGAPATLRQGKFHVSEQFEYACAIGEDASIGMFIGTFRRSFAVLAFTTTGPRAVFDDPPVPLRLWRPGSLADG
ncbi:MAG: hypothetical protein E7812_12485 [Phenylobacterium sp.]|nr:MAG: hypothetical protein E7812_12485 [Phenylobacterium sp.]